MAGELIYAFRIMRLPLLDAGGKPIGRLEDLVLVPGAGSRAPRVVGFVATSQRRQIFVNTARIGSLDSEGARLRSWDVDLNPFKPRPGEIILGKHVIDKRVGDETVSDIGLRSVTDGKSTWWEPAKVRLARRSSLRRRPSYRLVDIADVPTLFGVAAGGEMAAEAARLRDMHPSDVAGVVRALPLTQRKQLAAAMDDERLADLLEELPEAEQLRIIEGLDTASAAPLRLRVPATSLTELKIHQIRKILREHPGESPVYLHIGQGKVLRLADEFCVDLDRVVGELRMALGHDAVVL